MKKILILEDDELVCHVYQRSFANLFPESKHPLLLWAKTTAEAHKEFFSNGEICAIIISGHGECGCDGLTDGKLVAIFRKSFYGPIVIADHVGCGGEITCNDPNIHSGLEKCNIPKMVMNLIGKG